MTTTTEYEGRYAALLKAYVAEPREELLLRAARKLKDL